MARLSKLFGFPISALAYINALPKPKDDYDGNGNINDTVALTAGNDEANTGRGNDTVNGAGGADVIYGGSGNDALKGGTGADTLMGETGKDTLDGESGNDVLGGGDGDDLLSGGNDDDTLTGGAGNDRIDGGSGKDTAVFESLTGVSVDLLQGVASGVLTGTDQLFGIENVRTGEASDSVTGSAAANIIYTNEGDDQARGGGGNDELYGGKGNDVLNGGAGKDTLYGESGDDRLIGYSSQSPDTLEGDVLFGGLGIDTVDYRDCALSLSVNLGQRVAFGGAGTDILIGVENVYAGAGFDSLVGDSAANMLHGGAGDDQLIGGAGDDRLYGGDGFDIIYADAGDDRINGGEHDGVAMEDTLVFQDVNVSVDVDLAQGYAVSDETGNDAVRYIENVIGGNSNDLIVGGVDGNQLRGGDGADVLRGGDGIDYLFGDGGSDILQGGSGADQLFGGGGNDVFRFGSTSGGDLFSKDQIMDFTEGDKIHIFDLTFAELSISTLTSANLTYVSAGEQLAFTLSGLHNLDAADFIFGDL